MSPLLSISLLRGDGGERESNGLERGEGQVMAWPNFIGDPESVSNGFSRLSLFRLDGVELP
jgi:hypothetical protein